VSSTSSSSVINVASTSAAANAQWLTDSYESDDCLKVSNCMQTTPATPASLPSLPRNLFPIIPIYLDLVGSVAVAQMPSAGAPAAMLAVDLDLIHHHLGHACEAMCHTHVQHSELYSDAQKAHLCSSHLSKLCRVSALGKQVALPHQKAPTPPKECAERPGKIISTNLLTLEVPSIGGAHYVLAVHTLPLDHPTQAEE